MLASIFIITFSSLLFHLGDVAILTSFSFIKVFSFLPIAILTFDQLKLVNVFFLLIIASLSPPLAFFLIIVVVQSVFFLRLTVSIFLAEVYDFIPPFVIRLIK